MQVLDSVAIITGGASGLGEACARRLVADGGRAAIFDVAVERGKALAAELGKSALFCEVDVTSEKSVQDGVDATVSAFGAVHIAVNCAGVVAPGKVLKKDGPINLGGFSKTIQINLIGTMNVIRLAAEKMMANTPNEDGERGLVINTSSVAAYEGQIGQAAYSSSKAGIIGMTLPVAREFAAYGIRVMTIAPGIFETPMMGDVSEKVRESLNKMVPFPARMGKPSEFAMLVRHIIDNPMLNGSVIRLDGAIRMAAK